MNHEFYMQLALEEAKLAASKGEVPVGCVIVQDDVVIAKAHNLRESLQETATHAEMLAIKKANEVVGFWRLERCTLYSTLEPCMMCAGAIVSARIKHVVYGAKDPKGGCCGSLYNLVQDERFNHQCDVTSGVLEAECGQVLKDFFRSVRAKQKL